MASTEPREDDRLNNNGQSSGTESHIDSKDEYLEDPLPDLVGSLRIAEEVEPDFLESTEYVLEDFEFTISTSDEDDGEESGSDLEFYDATTPNALVEDLLDSENVSVELELRNEGSGGEGGSGPETVRTRLGKVKATATRMANSVKEMVGKRKRKVKTVRVVYHNLDKPYTARVSATQTFKRFLTLGQGQEPQSFGSMSQSSSINDNIGSPIEMGMSAEELEAARQEWQAELNQIEEEIQTLRQVLHAKTRRAHELKRKLGVNVWNELATDMGQGIKNVRESTAVQKIEETFTEIGSAVTSAPLYQKTESAVKATAEKTTTFLGGIGSAVSQKIGALKNTDSFRSMEERVSSAVSSVKTKMGGSRSGSVQSFDDALREATANQGGTPDGGVARPNGTPTPSATPVAGEEKPLS